MGTVNTTTKTRGFGLPRKAGRFAWFVGVGIAIGVAIAIAIGSELKRTAMRDSASCSILDCDCDPESDSDPDRTACRNGRACQGRTAVGRGFDSR